MSGQPRPTRPRSISVLTPADLVGGWGGRDPPPTPHATLHPRSHDHRGPLSLPFHPSSSVSVRLEPLRSLLLLRPGSHPTLGPSATPRAPSVGPARRGQGGGFIARHHATFHLSLSFSPSSSLSSSHSGLSSQPRLEKKRWRVWEKEERKVEEEGVISVGRAGCIRSNIMQAHTGLDALDPFDPLPPPLLHDAHAQRNAYIRVCVCVCVYIHGIERVESRFFISLPFPLILSLSFSPPVYLPFVCIYLYPSCIEIARALNPGSGHEIVIPERLTLLPHLAGAPRSSLKVRKVRGRTERQRRMKDART